MDKTKKQAKLKDDIALIQKRNKLRYSILIMVFSATFFFLFDVSFQMWLEDKSLQVALNSFSRYNVISTVVFWFCLYYLFNPQFETKTLARKRAELKQLETETSF